MTEKIKLIQGDTRPALVCTITDETSGNPIDLTGTTVEMKFRIVGSDVLQATIPGSLTNPVAGVVTFLPSAAPEMLQGVAGDYEGQISITFNDGTTQTIYDPLKFKVKEDF